MLTAFVSSFQTFTDRLATLNQSSNQQNLASVGVSAVKEAKQSIVIDKVYAVSSAMVAFGVVNSDVELINHMKSGKHEMKSSGRDQLLILVDRIALRATDLVGQLDDYGVG